MSNNQQPVTVNILDKEYRISCQEDEREALIESSLYLDGKMREVRRTGRVIGTEKIAVMVALNIVHEYLELSKHKADTGEDISRRIQSLQQKIESAIQSSNELDL